MSNPNLAKEWITLSKHERLHGMEVPVIGLTGGIATGKSTCAEWFKEHGVKIISADALVKKIYQEPNTIDWAKSKNFPMKDGGIDFKSLREIFFKDPNLKNEIEAFIYKELPFAFKNEWTLLGSPAWLIYDIPLLFEKNMQNLFDQTILVYAPKTIQLKRLIKRDLISQDLANHILDQQIDIEVKKKLSKWIIDNSDDTLPMNQNKDLQSIWKRMVN